MAILLKRPPSEITANLPPSVELPHLYDTWLSLYLKTGATTRLSTDANAVINVSFLEDCYDAAEKLKALRASQSMVAIASPSHSSIEPTKKYSDKIRILVILGNS
jgi:hypothetical protein